MKKHLSIIIPLHNEEGNVEELVLQIKEVMSALQYVYEVILVNDGSGDNTWTKIRSCVTRYSFIHAIDLAGNYGQTIALRAGIEAAKGEVIIAMDGDLQHDPSYIPRFLELIEAGYDLVGGSKHKRPEGVVKSFFSSVAHKMICKLSGVNMQYFGATFKAYRSYLLKNTNMLGDSHRFLGAIVARKGIKYTEFPIDIHERKSGKSNYKWSKVFFVILDLIFLKFIVSYINKPFRLFGSIGILSFLAGLLPTLFFVTGSLFWDFNIRQDYMAEFMFSVSLMILGTLFISIGIVAEIGVYNYFAKGNHGLYSVRENLVSVFPDVSVHEKNYN